MKNYLIKYLVETQFLNYTTRTCDVKTAYTIYVFQKQLKQKYEDLQNELKSFLESRDLLKYLQSDGTLTIDKLDNEVLKSINDCILTINNVVVDVILDKITFEQWFNFSNENKINNEITMLLENIVWEQS